jgi:hypothetical protein
MMKLLPLLLLCGVMYGQNLKLVFPAQGGHEAKPDKRCAFDLKPQTIRDTRPIKPTAKDEMFPPETVFSLGVAVSPRLRNVCPYERAIELFGEDRVAFEEVPERDTYKRSGQDSCKDGYEPMVKLSDEHPGGQPECTATKTNQSSERRVLVDGEVVYSEWK